MKNKCLMLVICAVLIAALTLSACSTKQPTQSNDKTPKEPVTIRFVDVMPGPERDAIYKELIDKFNADNPGIKVVLETIPWDQAHNKLVTLGTSNSMPDVIMVHTGWRSEFINAGWISKLDSNYEKFKYKDSLIPYIKDIAIKKEQQDVYGNIYYMTDALNTHALFVRSDWFKEANLPLPTTWDEVFAAAEKLTDKSKNRYGFSYRGARLGFEQIMDYVFTETGGRLYDEKGNCLLSTPEAVAAYKRYTDIYKNGYSPKDSLNWGYSEMVQGFTSGLVGILNQTSEVITTCQGSMKDGTWTVIPFPKGKDGKIHTQVNGFGYSIAANSKHPDEAWKFIEYLSSPEASIKYAKGNGFIPVVKEAADDPFFKEGPMKGFFDTMNSPDLVKQPEWGYFNEMGEFREAMMDAETQKYLLGKQTAEETLKKFADYLTKYQQKYMQENPKVPVPQPIVLGK